MFFQLQIESKNKKVLKNFLQFFHKLNKDLTIWNVKSKLNKKDVITVLKSPHVNKTAQEQFEYRVYSKKFIIYSFKPAFFILTLKKIKELSFPGVKIKFELLSFEFNKFKSVLKVFEPTCVKINIYDQNINFEKCFLNYIKLFDCYGELFLKQKV